MDSIEFSENDFLVYEGREVHVVPLGALATWGQLLGYTNAVDCLDAILHKDRMVEADENAEVDPETGGTIWDEVMAVSRHLEQVREDEAYKASSEKDAIREYDAALRAGDWDAAKQCKPRVPEHFDPRSVELRSALAVRSELVKLTGSDCPESETLLAKCQKRARDVLGLSHPSAPPSAVRSGFMSCDSGTRCESGERELTAEERDRCSSLLEGAEGWLAWRRKLYCHQLTGHTHDPLDDHTLPEEQAPQPPTSVEEMAHRYATTGGRRSTGSVRHGATGK